MLRTLRDVGGDLVLTIPREFAARHGLADGSRVELHHVGKRMSVSVPRRPRYRAADLMAEMPEGLPRTEGWEEMLLVGNEDDSGAVKPAGKGTLRFSAAQEHVDRVAMRLGLYVAALGAAVAILTVAALAAKCLPPLLDVS